MTLLFDIVHEPRFLFGIQRTQHHGHMVVAQETLDVAKKGQPRFNRIVVSLQLATS